MCCHILSGKWIKEHSSQRGIQCFLLTNLEGGMKLVFTGKFVQTLEFYFIWWYLLIRSLFTHNSTFTRLYWYSWRSRWRKNERRQENGQQDMSTDRPTPTKHDVMTWIIIPVLGSWRITLYNLRKTGSKGSKQPAKHHSFELVESCKWKFIQFISPTSLLNFPTNGRPVLCNKSTTTGSHLWVATKAPAAPQIAGMLEASSSSAWKPPWQRCSARDLRVLQLRQPNK